MENVGTSLDKAGLPQDYYTIQKGPEDGNTVTFPLARPVEITGPYSAQCITATWVCIQWGRSGGDPDVVYYGNGRLEPLGGFELPGDLTVLLSAIDVLAYYEPTVTVIVTGS